MQAGNKGYRKASDIPDTVPVFPLSGALLLPGGQLPLNLFEPRYLAMFDFALAGDRLIGMVQPRFDMADTDEENPPLCEVGCLGRITSFTESGDGRYLISLHGVCRYRIMQELAVRTPFRQCRIAPFLADLDDDRGGAGVDREGLLRAFRAWLEANNMEADWESVKKAGNETLVNALSMMSPYGPAEKQALLEAADLKLRAETLIAITEITLARGQSGEGGTLQ